MAGHVQQPEAAGRVSAVVVACEARRAWHAGRVIEASRP